MDKNSKILIVGHNDIIEKSLYHYFLDQGYLDVVSWSRKGLNVLDQDIVRAFFEAHQPEYVFLGSTRSGGIGANQEFPGEFIYHNLQSLTNIIHTAHNSGVKKLMYFTGSCAYPKEAEQPIREEALLTGSLEETSAPYAVSKIAGVKMCQAYRKQYGFNAISVVPATLYGPDASDDPDKAHVLGALMGKFYQATQEQASSVDVWGTGQARREFLYVDDFVQAALYLMEHYEGEDLINVGAGNDISIEELANKMKEITGFSGNIHFDASKPDGAMRKLMDVNKINQLGWKAQVSLEDGIQKTYNWYVEHKGKDVA